MTKSKNLEEKTEESFRAREFAIDFFIKKPAQMLLVPGGMVTYLRDGFREDEENLRKYNEDKSSISQAHYEGIKHRKHPVTKGPLYTVAVGIEIIKLWGYFEIGKSIYQNFFG